MQPLRLRATESNWRLFMIRKADPAFRAFETKIFERDQHTCQFCGFCAPVFQEIINIDGNYTNNKLSNLATACMFCAQTGFLESLGKSDFGGGTLICLPEISQHQLNALCHALFASMLGVGSSMSQAKNFYRSLRIRAQMVEEQLGEGMSNPGLVGQLIIDVDAAGRKKILRELDDKIRLLPNVSRYAKFLTAWSSAAITAMSFDDE